jgi:hypothetical protein
MAVKTHRRRRLSHEPLAAGAAERWVGPKERCGAVGRKMGGGTAPGNFACVSNDEGYGKMCSYVCENK